MRLLIRALFVVIGFVLLGITLFHAVRLGYEWHERAAGPNLHDAAVILACLAGLVAMWWTDRALVRAEETRKLLRLARGFDGERLVARLSVPWMIFLLAVMVGMAAFPLVVLPDLFRHFELKPALGALACTFAALVLAGIFLPYLWRRGPTLVVDADGVAHVLFGRIPWTQVHGIHLRVFETSKGGKQYALVLGVADTARWRANVPAMHRWMGLGKRDAFFHDTLAIPLNLLNVEPDLVHLAATTLRDRVAPPRMQHWAPGMSLDFVDTAQRHDAHMARMESLLQQLEQANARTDAGASAEVARLEGEVDAAIKDLQAAQHDMFGTDPLANKR